MSTRVNRRIVLNARPDGFPTEADFRMVEGPAPEPGAGEMIVRTIYLSLDPYMRGRMNAGPSYAAPVELGDVMTGGTVGQVVASRHDGFAEGDLVLAGAGWQEYGLSDGRGVRKLDPGAAPVSTALGVLGMPGLTAYVGLLEVGGLKAGDVVVVSAASGAVGAVVGQRQCQPSTCLARVCLQADRHMPRGTTLVHWGPPAAGMYWKQCRLVQVDQPPSHFHRYP